MCKSMNQPTVAKPHGKDTPVSRRRLIILGLMVVPAIWIGFGLLIFYRHFGIVGFEQLLFHIRRPNGGLDENFVSSLIIDTIPYTVMLSALFLLAAARRRPAFLTRAAVPIAVLLLVAALGALVVVTDLHSYFRMHLTQTNALEHNYTDTFAQEPHLGGKRRNLIHIYLESMESSFTSRAYGGAEEVDLIPGLRQLAEQNVHFSNTDRLGGAVQFPNLAWTTAGMVAQSGGLPLKEPIDHNRYGGYGSFLPGMWSLGDILAREGYEQVLILGADANFAGTNYFFAQHGGFSIFDWKEAKKRGLIPDNYKESWGFEDRKAFAYARAELSRLAAGNKPFNLTLFTLDLHFPAYRCPECLNTHRSTVADVIACTDRQTTEFIRWIQAQPFYADTTIILSGDHLSMDKPFFVSYPASYERTVFNTIINPAALPDGWKERCRNRRFSTIDFFPTIACALGIEWTGDRLALGTNLFSDTPTLLEEMGPDAYTEMLTGYSAFYNHRFLYGTPPQPSDG